MSFSADIKEERIIKQGFNEELDKLFAAKTEGAKWVREMEAREKEETGIKTLKIKYNKVFGYCIEVSKSFTDQVPEHYTRRQTLANGERYITPELKALEDMILGASEKISALESQLYQEIIRTLKENIIRLKEICDVIADLDCLCSFSVVASTYNYVKPEISESDVL